MDGSVMGRGGKRREQGKGRGEHMEKAGEEPSVAASTSWGEASMVRCEEHFILSMAIHFLTVFLKIHVFIGPFRVRKQCLAVGGRPR